MTFSAAPYAQGLYDPANEHDSCGVAVVVDARGRRSHAMVEAGMTALRSLEHRGAAGSEVNSRDGVGILIQVPHGLLGAVADFPLPGPTASGEPPYAVGDAFLPAGTGRNFAAGMSGGVAHVLNLDRSAVAETILTDWPRHSAAFSTIMPRDYKRVLQAGRMAELSGRDVDDAIMEAARG